MLKTNRWMLGALTAAVVAFAGFAIAADEKSEEKVDLKNVTCVVSGHEVADGTVTTCPKGKKIYLCCADCEEAIKKDPEKFATKIAHQLAQTKQVAQVGCPLSGRKVNEETAVDVQGVKVAFCCKNCQAKAEKASGEELIALVFSKEAFEKGFTLQNKCPVSGGNIKAANFTEYKGEKVYFCCPNCPKAFEKDPAKYEAKLPQLDKEETAAK